MLDSIAIEKEFKRKGFLRVKKGESKTIAYNLGPDCCVHLKVSATGKAMTTSPLVLDPEKYKALRSSLHTISGLSVDGDYFSAGLTGFPSKINGGVTPTHYGTHVSVRDPETLDNLLDVLLGRKKFSEADENIRETVADPETIRKALVDARVGQGLFRQHLLEYWTTCSVTGLTTPELLKASHIKPWRDASNPERLDLYNGLLLSANMDAAFDSGLISFEDDGTILVSSQFKDEAEMARIHPAMKLRSVAPQHAPYLAYHRTHIFRK